MNRPQPLPTQAHEPDCGGTCIHLIGDMPHIITLNREAVSRLNFQPRITAAPQPVIAARHGNLLVLSVHMIGPLATRHRGRGMNGDRRVTHHWYFELTEYDGGRVIAVQFQPETAAAHG